ncbi:YpoC family protein [Bacillus sp. FJAT-18017]|uniref:YpoC family protein n=1 Tax=Bacillus sp. FJAT-18017 TaxID=1705566 RepID=UPI0006AFF657|nr:hypothetical protein [Bacillus sp. FJAT-18017]
MPEHNSSLPKQLEHPFFSEVAAQLFPDEAGFFYGAMAAGPWEESYISVPGQYEVWNEVSKKIEEAFKEKNKPRVREEMREGISNLLKILYWSNKQPVKLNKLNEVDSLALKPVNCQERLYFLIERPELFHSYIQLKQLMEEQKKQFMKNIAIKKGSTR